MRLAAVDLPANVDTLIHTIPVGQRAVLTINLCNRASESAEVSVAMTDGEAPEAADWIEYRTPLPSAGASGGSAMQLTGLALGAGQKLFARSNKATVSTVVHGVQESV